MTFSSSTASYSLKLSTHSVCRFFFSSPVTAASVFLQSPKTAMSEEGRAVTVPEALTAVENRLKSLNADVQVEQEEYDEVVVIKAMFLNHDYQ